MAEIIWSSWPNIGDAIALLNQVLPPPLSVTAYQVYDLPDGSLGIELVYTDGGLSMSTMLSRYPPAGPRQAHWVKLVGFRIVNDYSSWQRFMARGRER